MDHKIKIHTCSQCGREFSNVELTAFDGASLCPDCLESTTVCCQDCGMRMWRDDNAGTDEHPLCESCRTGIFGYTSDDVDLLIADGISPEDIEEYFYSGEC